MKKVTFFVALSAMALVTGCSSDEMTEVNKGNAIDFSVTASKQSRAVATTTSSIDAFKVWAFTDGQTYMNGVTVNKNGSSWEYADTKFWPESDVDFFSISPVTPASGTVSVTTSSKTITDYEANGTEDLLYSANVDEKKADHNSAPVSVNFRHALSQIVFKVKNTNPNSITVKVKAIKVYGVAKKASLTWATVTTGTWMSSDTKADTETGATWGIWSTPTDLTCYKVDATDANGLTVPSDEASYISTADGNGALFLMPQTLNPWLTVADNVATVTGTARLLIMCQIVDTTTGIQLWPKADTGAKFADVAVSLTNPTNDPNRGDTEASHTAHDKWMQGKKYIYTLLFGEGGGYEPEPDPTPDPKPGPDPTPDPVLVPITFTVTVDEFQDGGTYDLDLKTEKGNAASGN